MWITDAPWWEYFLRGALVYVALMLLIRLSGKRTVGEFTPFDLVVVILVGESTQGALVGSDQSVTGGLLAATTLVFLNYLVAFFSARSRRFDRVIEGEPVVLVRHGVVRDVAMKKNHIPRSDLDEAIRGAELTDVREVELGMLETNGRITIVPRDENRGE